MLLSYRVIPRLGGTAREHASIRELYFTQIKDDDQIEQLRLLVERLKSEDKDEVAGAMILLAPECGDGFADLYATNNELANTTVAALLEVAEGTEEKWLLHLATKALYEVYQWIIDIEDAPEDHLGRLRILSTKDSRTMFRLLPVLEWFENDSIVEGEG